MKKTVLILFALMILFAGCTQENEKPPAISKPSEPPVKVPPVKQPPVAGDQFCGTSTNGPCLEDSDCVSGGCSGQVCQSKTEKPIATTCEYRDCYDAGKYDVGCSCNDGKCQWSDIPGSSVRKPNFCPDTGDCNDQGSDSRKCAKAGDCVASCSYGCVGSGWIAGKIDCKAIWPDFNCECIDGACQRV